MDKQLRLFRLDDRRRRTVAVLHPDGTITGTEDERLVRAVRDALAKPATATLPDLSYVSGVPAKLAPDYWTWPVLVIAGLRDAGLGGEPIGWEQPDYGPAHEVD